MNNYLKYSKNNNLPMITNNYGLHRQLRISHDSTNS